MRSRSSVVFLTFLCIMMLGAIGIQADRTDSKRLIVPGKSIGQVRLGEYMEPVYQRMGKPTDSDAAAGNLYDTWESGGNKVVVHSIWGGKDDHRRVITSVNVTSPYFRTRAGVGAGSGWPSIHRAFPAAKRAAEPESTPAGLKYRFADDKRRISFDILCPPNRELPQGHCVGVEVWAHGR